MAAKSKPKDKIHVNFPDANTDRYRAVRERASELQSAVRDMASRTSDPDLTLRLAAMSRGLVQLIEALDAAIAGGPNPIDDQLALELRAAVHYVLPKLDPEGRAALALRVKAVGDEAGQIPAAETHGPWGTLKWFNEAKGFGFITPEGGGEDLFASGGAILSPRFQPLEPGLRVQFEVTQGPKGKQASNIQAAMPPIRRRGPRPREGSIKRARKGPTAAPTVTSARKPLAPPTRMEPPSRAPKAMARAKPPETRREPEHRRVVLDLYDVTERGARRKVADRLESKRCYELELFIAAHHAGGIVANEAFRSETLPMTDVTLAVHFVPLQPTKPRSTSQVQHKRLKLPVVADSKACKFEFVVPASITSYRARIILSYRNRILQTLILSAPVDKAKGPFRLEAENVVDPAMEFAEQRAGFDAALIVNHSPSGKTGVTTVRGKEAIFGEPNGILAMTENLQKFILKNAALRAGKKFESKEVQALIYGLSRRGKMLWDGLPASARNLLKDSTRRIQIVDARDGAYYPAEFVHRGRSPNEGAKPCPNAAAALLCPTAGAKGGAKSHESCKHRDDPNFTCPMRMWGFGLVIERQPPMGTPQLGFVLRDVKAAIAGKRIDVLDRVVVALSSKVAGADKKAPRSLLASLQKAAKHVTLARNWDHLKETIKNESPTLLVLVPHSDIDVEDSEIQTLELGGKSLALDRVEADCVKGPRVNRPVVLLLGCETKTGPIPFLNFVARFKDCGAAMVMGTITEVDALRTVSFVERFVTAFAASKNRTSFGEQLLETRRQLLAAGDGYAMSLLAYGDTDTIT